MGELHTFITRIHAGLRRPKSSRLTINVGLFAPLLQVTRPQQAPIGKGFGLEPTAINAKD